MRAALDFERVALFWERVGPPRRGASRRALLPSEAENETDNGLKLVRYFHKLWAAPSLTNNIAAFKDLVSIKVPAAENPRPYVKQTPGGNGDFPRLPHPERRDACRREQQAGSGPRDASACR